MRIFVGVISGVDRVGPIRCLPIGVVPNGDGSGSLMVIDQGRYCSGSRDFIVATPPPPQVASQTCLINSANSAASIISADPTIDFQNKTRATCKYEILNASFVGSMTGYTPALQWSNDGINWYDDTTNAGWASDSTVAAGPKASSPKSITPQDRYARLVLKSVANTYTSGSLTIRMWFTIF